MNGNVSDVNFKTVALFGGIFLFIAGFFAGGYATETKFIRFLDRMLTHRITYGPYSLISPLIGTESPSALEVGRFKGMYREIISYAQSHKTGVDSYSVYYRDLNSAQWFGINENEPYIPASLLKIALAISLLKQGEEDHSFRSIRKTFTQEIATINHLVPFLEPSKLVVGETYTIEELIRKMLIDSDNGAKDLLFNVLDKKYFFDVFKLLGIQEPTDALEYTLSVKEYALFIRMLYNGTYLTAENSQMILELMTQTKFPNGLRAGIPHNVAVAHKYGTFTLTNSEGSRNGIELHDCGVVYHEHPYILCIMTKGEDANTLSAFIAGISKVLYEKVDENFKNSE